MKWFLIVYLGLESNYAVVDEFKTEVQCNQKKYQYVKALEQAKSELAVKCIKM